MVKFPNDDSTSLRIAGSALSETGAVMNQSGPFFSNVVFLPAL
jgi:hypothetical protein